MSWSRATSGATSLWLMWCARRSSPIGPVAPTVSLKPKLALSLGMVIHELATNSVKYGSLSAAGGSLEVSWAIERRSGESLVFDWVERGGPPVGKPPRHGFGLTLIEREVNHGLGGKAKIEFEDGVLRVNLRIPLDSQ